MGGSEGRLGRERGGLEGVQVNGRRFERRRRRRRRRRLPTLLSPPTHPPSPCLPAL
jgi:hypothetical protein